MMIWSHRKKLRSFIMIMIMIFMIILLLEVESSDNITNEVMMEYDENSYLCHKNNNNMMTKNNNGQHQQTNNEICYDDDHNVFYYNNNNDDMNNGMKMNHNTTLTSDNNKYSSKTNDDVIILRYVFFISFLFYIMSLSTLGKYSITHTWLFTNLIIFQPTTESITSIIRSEQQHKQQQHGLNENRRQQPRQQQQTRGQQQNRQQQHTRRQNRQQRQQQRRINNRRQMDDEKNNNNTNKLHIIDEQLSLLEFTKMKIQPGRIIALQQHSINNNNININDDNDNNNNNNIDNDNTTTTANNNNNTIRISKSSFTIWKYLETTVLCCLSCFVILIIRWMSHIQYCQNLYTTLHDQDNNRNWINYNSNDHTFDSFIFSSSSSLSNLKILPIIKAIISNNNNDHHDQEELQQQWNYDESNDARWWLMLFILLSILTWFHLAYMSCYNTNDNNNNRNNIPPSSSSVIPSYITGIGIACYVWMYLRTSPFSNNNNNNNVSMDDGLHELTSRILLLLRLFGWEKTDNSNNEWDIIYMSLRCMVTIFCFGFGYVISIPIYTLQYSMIYRLYNGSTNDIQYKIQNLPRINTSRWYNTNSKRIFFMECSWKIIVLIIALLPCYRFILYYYIANYMGSTNNENQSIIIAIKVIYVSTLCILVSKFQQDYLFSSLPKAVIILFHRKLQQLYYSRNRNNNDMSNNHNGGTGNHHFDDVIDDVDHDNDDDPNNDDDNDDDDDDLYEMLKYPFIIRIETLLKNGTKLVCIPLLLSILFSIHHISDFQRGITPFPSPYGGKLLSHHNMSYHYNQVHIWHQYRTILHMSSYLSFSSTAATNDSYHHPKHNNNNNNSIQCNNNNADFGCNGCDITNTTTSLNDDDMTSIHDDGNQCYNTNNNTCDDRNTNRKKDVVKPRKFLFNDLLSKIVTGIEDQGHSRFVYNNRQHNNKDINASSSNNNNTNMMDKHTTSSLHMETSFAKNVSNLSRHSVLHELKNVAISRSLNVTLLSTLRKLQKLAKESLNDPLLRSCLIDAYCDDSNSTTAVEKDQMTTNTNNNNNNNKNQQMQADQEESNKKLSLLKHSKVRVDETFHDLWEIFDAILHHPLITAETVYIFSEFIDYILCFYWTLTIIPLVIFLHQKMIQIRLAFLQLNASSLHANPQDAAD